MRLNQPCSSIDSPKQDDLHFIACEKTTTHTYCHLCVTSNILTSARLIDTLLTRDNSDLHIFLVCRDQIEILYHSCRKIKLSNIFEIFWSTRDKCSIEVWIKQIMRSNNATRNSNDILNHEVKMANESDDYLSECK